MVPDKAKTEAVHFGSKTEKIVVVGGVHVLVGNNMKMLGIWVNSELRWDIHIEKTVIKCCSLSYAMRFPNKFFSKREMITFFSVILFAVRSDSLGPEWHKDKL